MAPSTATPTDLHRAPVACLMCRKAKVRCLFSRRREQCDRCIVNDAECVVAQAKRARGRAQPYPPRTRRDDRQSVEEPASNSTRTLRSPPEQVETGSGNDQQQPPLPQQPIITHEVRARIIAALATLKGKRGAPFSFVTSGDSPAFSAKSGPSGHPSGNAQGRGSSELSQANPVSLKLSWLLRPLTAGAHRETGDQDRPTPGGVKMPTYLASMSLGQTITDPIEGGMVTLEASKALFTHFMVQMNSKWEYVLDPHVDTHESVQRRSAVLFAVILFCSSKFANYNDGHLAPETDPFLQGRLCSLARNLVIKSLAAGDRSIETMQALYLLVCWKDPEDDVSYLHSGYAFSTLRDLDLESAEGDGRLVARRRRTWLALFRQDRQQSLFFVRRAPLNHADEAVPFLVNPDTWLKMPHALPGDLVACCSADIRCAQYKLRTLIQKSSPFMMPCLLDLINEELRGWRSKWSDRLLRGSGAPFNADPPVYDELIHPGKPHITILLDVWEHSVRLNVALAILRQSLLASMTQQLHSNRQRPSNTSDLDLNTLQNGLPSTLPGLEASVSGTFGTLQHLMKFPPEDLRRAPDAILLLAPNAALFLCLLLCLPPTGILGPAFQVTAVGLVRDIALHIAKCVQSPQDSVTLHSAYLNALVDLFEPSTSQSAGVQPVFDSSMQIDMNGLDVDTSTLQAAQVLADGIGSHEYNIAPDGLLRSSGDLSQNLHMQSLANLLDEDLFWDLLPGSEDGIVGL